MVLFHVPDLIEPLCADRSLLPIVDAAFARPGGPEAQQLRTNLCPTCPAHDSCLDEALTRGEWGIWGGTSPNGRTRLGGTKPKIGSRVA